MPAGSLGIGIRDVRAPALFRSRFPKDLPQRFQQQTVIVRAGANPILGRLIAVLRLLLLAALAWYFARQAGFFKPAAVQKSA